MTFLQCSPFVESPINPRQQQQLSFSKISLLFVSVCWMNTMLRPTVPSEHTDDGHEVVWCGIDPNETVYPSTGCLLDYTWGMNY